MDYTKEEIKFYESYNLHIVVKDTGFVYIGNIQLIFDDHFLMTDKYGKPRTIRFDNIASIDTCEKINNSGAGNDSTN